MPTLQSTAAATAPAVTQAHAVDGGRTVAGTALQATWVAYLAYGAWAAAALPEHPEPPIVVAVALEVVALAILAASVGLLFRRRWAVRTSAVLALPMVALAVMCVLADAGNHWIAEAGFAVAVVGLSLHPASWRMHDR
jgi:hypothetical protein